MGVTAEASAEELREIPDHGITYARVELKNLRLSHAAALFLLQGASLRQLLDGVTLSGEGPKYFYSVVFAEFPVLWKPPPHIPRVVLARVLETNERRLSGDGVLQAIFLSEIP